jgi:hypothetical protein
MVFFVVLVALAFTPPQVLARIERGMARVTRVITLAYTKLVLRLTCLDDANNQDSPPVAYWDTLSEFIWS